MEGLENIFYQWEILRNDTKTKNQRRMNKGWISKKMTNKKIPYFSFPKWTDVLIGIYHNPGGSISDIARKTNITNGYFYAVIKIAQEKKLVNLYRNHTKRKKGKLQVYLTDNGNKVTLQLIKTKMLM